MALDFNNISKDYKMLLVKLLTFRAFWIYLSSKSSQELILESILVKIISN